MSDWIIYGIGFFAQLLFSARIIHQWRLSEKQQKIVTPTIFWKLSLLASILLFVYGYLRKDFAIMLGQTLTYYIYIRNLQLQHQWIKLSKPMQWFLFIFPIIFVIYSFNNGIYDMDSVFKNTEIPIWLLILGSISQIFFTFRFIYQWVYSENKKKSILPPGFWWISIIGACLILIYAFFRKDPVLIIAHAFGIFIYLRNILINKKSNKRIEPIHGTSV